MAKNRRGKTYVVPVKMRRLDRNVDVRVRAARALGRLGGEIVVEPLVEALNDENLVDMNVVSFRAIQDKLVNIYAKKNHDYGDSFNEGCNELGVGYAFSRIFDKTKRFQTLAKGIMNNNLSYFIRTINTIRCSIHY